MTTWEELEKQVFAHNTEVCAHIRQSLGKLPTIKHIDFEDDEETDEEIFFSPPSSKVLGTQLVGDAVPAEASRNNAKPNDANEAKHNTSQESETAFKTTKGSRQRMPSKKFEETSLNSLKLPNISEPDSHQTNEAFANCLAAGETVFNLIDDL